MLEIRAVRNSGDSYADGPHTWNTLYRRRLNLKTINLDRLRSVRLKLRRGLVKLTMCSAVGLDER